MSCFDGLYLKKLRSACSNNSFGPNGAPLGARLLTTSARSVALLLASFDVALPSEREKPSWIDWRIEISSSTRWVLLTAQSIPRAQVASSSEPSRYLLCATILYIISTSCVYMLSRQRARSQQPHASRDRARAPVGPSTFWRLANRCLSLRAAACSYFASHRMALTRQRKNPSQITREIKFFSNFS